MCEYNGIIIFNPCYYIGTKISNKPYVIDIPRHIGCQLYALHVLYIIWVADDFNCLTNNC